MHKAPPHAYLLLLATCQYESFSNLFSFCCCCCFDHHLNFVYSVLRSVSLSYIFFFFFFNSLNVLRCAISNFLCVIFFLLMHYSRVRFFSPLDELLICACTSSVGHWVNKQTIFPRRVVG